MDIKKIKELNFIWGLIAGVLITSFLGLILYGISNLGILNFTKKLPAQTSYSPKENKEAKEPIEIPASLEELSESAKAEVLAYLRFKQIKESFISTGVPDVYGQELNISFDQVQDAINKVALLDPTYGPAGEKITLTGDDLKRYIKIGFQIACEYCCGATTLVFEDGEAACGCEHSQMMRGLAAYLIKNHPEISDEKILEELNLWKRTYFPKQMLSAKLQELEKAGEPGIKEILEEFPEFLPEMVGGC